MLWDKLHARYPMFNQESESVTSIWLEYDEDFKTFYENAIKDIQKYRGIESMYAKGALPSNFYDITSIPWVSFTSFQVDMYCTDGSWLLPMVAIGKYFNQDDKILMPVHIKVHHATCDGYHVGVFFNELQNLALKFQHYLECK